MDQFIQFGDAICSLSDIYANANQGFSFSLQKTLASSITLGTEQEPSRHLAEALRTFNNFELFVQRDRHLFYDFEAEAFQRRNMHRRV
jgi:hypothetical protein